MLSYPLTDLRFMWCLGLRMYNAFTRFIYFYEFDLNQHVYVLQLSNVDKNEVFANYDRCPLTPVRGLCTDQTAATPSVT